MSQRYMACLSYVGTSYKGWQSQPKHPSVQACVEQALSQIANHPVSIICAGRTDSGVHALKQVIHFDSNADRLPHQWLNGCNRYLPHDIQLHSVIPVASNFHARFSALSRRYAYFIYQSPIYNPFYHHRMLWLKQPLNLEAMRQAAQYWIGEHDFSSFRDKDCQAHTPFRELMHCDVIATESDVIRFDFKANAFLHHMIRNMLGVLIPIGLEKKPIHWAKSVLNARIRAQAGQTMPPHGLYFMDVYYPNSATCTHAPNQQSSQTN